MFLLPLETELFMPTWAFGVLTFVIFMILLAITIGMGTYRKHSK